MYKDYLTPKKIELGCNGKETHFDLELEDLSSSPCFALTSCLIWGKCFDSSETSLLSYKMRLYQFLPNRVSIRVKSHNVSKTHMVDSLQDDAISSFLLCTCCSSRVR